jgi:hypothetical protein
VSERRIAGVGQEILLRDIGDILCLGVFRIDVIEGLVLARTDVFGDGLIPLFRVGKDGIDIEDDAPEGKDAMPDHVADLKPCLAMLHGTPLNLPCRRGLACAMDVADPR